ncbi:BTB/POZ domain-containing protein [Cardamine amara subsp. amara]|uniref:BTB/POZ domain-containing protein n=1 Tax=Cardamine amara subsp. amara TaxID=228776 RepID=A0ABD1BHC9_CARAN
MALKESIHPDIIVKPGDNGQGIYAHKAVLAVRSKVFRNMLESDECKVSPEESITIPDLSYEELKSLLEFFYNGTLSPNNKHIRALYLAADKYDIQYLQDVCREQIISNLSIDNVLDILELSTIPSDNILKQAALLAFASRYSLMIFSQRFESFALKNPHLNLEITRACWHRFSACLRKYLQEQPR